MLLLCMILVYNLWLSLYKQNYYNPKLGLGCNFVIVYLNPYVLIYFLNNKEVYNYSYIMNHMIWCYKPRIL